MADACGSILTLLFMFALMAFSIVISLMPFIIMFTFAALFLYSIFKMMVPTSGAGGVFFGAARTDLDPVEAGVVLGTNPLRLLGTIVMSLVRKGYLRVKATNPLMVEVVPVATHDRTLCASCGAPLKEGGRACNYCGVTVAQAEVLAYYESAFLNSAISSDGTLDEGGSNGVIRMLESQVEAKMAGCSPEATREHYKKVLSGLWRQLESVPDDAKAYDFSRNAGWLALDDEFSGKSAGYSKDKRVSRLLGAMRETVEDSGIDGAKLG